MCCVVGTRVAHFEQVARGFWLLMTLDLWWFGPGLWLALMEALSEACQKLAAACCVVPVLLVVQFHMSKLSLSQCCWDSLWEGLHCAFGGVVHQLWVQRKITIRESRIQWLWSMCAHSRVPCVLLYCLSCISFRSAWAWDQLFTQQISSFVSHVGRGTAESKFNLGK